MDFILFYVSTGGNFSCSIYVNYQNFYHSMMLGEIIDDNILSSQESGGQWW